MPRRGLSADDLAVVAGVAVIAVAASCRQEFIGDGVRHVSHVLAAHAPYLGEARWLLFPPILFALLRPLVAAGLVRGVEAAIQPFLWMCVACGLLLLWSLRTWLRAETSDRARSAAALLLAATCAPFVRLYSDVAEPQLAAALAVAALAFARSRRDDPVRAAPALLCAVGTIACAALIYQGVVLALAFVPLVASAPTLSQRRVLLAWLGAPILVALALVLIQAAGGLPLALSVQTAFAGESNPITRAFMSHATLPKYLVAIVAGAPQGFVWITGFSGMSALVAGVRGPDWFAALGALLRLGAGGILVIAMVVAIVRSRDWRAALALASVLALPVLRNQQYAYVKFFVLWPALAALLAVRFRARHVLIAALLLGVLNGWVLGAELVRGRHSYAATAALYRTASPTTCWMTSGWGPPFDYLWPGSSSGVLATLATGTDPAFQGRALTASLQQCFCGAAEVWTDTAADSAPVVRFLEREFLYDRADLTRLLIEPSTESRVGTSPPMYVYSSTDRAEACRFLTAVR